jgi:hypothetical protein
MKVKNKKEVIEALDDCLLFINKRLDKKTKKDPKKQEKEKLVA